MLTLLDDPLWFPDPSEALLEPNGLLAVGGDLSPERLLLAYRMGIFPWFDQSQPLLWWSPDPRAVLEPDKLHVSRSLARLARRGQYRLTINTAFDQVIRACRQLRETQEAGTWITAGIEQAYVRLHRLGHAHSVEVWQDEQLVAGLYGIGLGRLFCGESMFHRVDNGSKLAMLGLCRHLQRQGGELIDCQLPNPHLMTLGVTTWPRARFLHKLKELQQQPLAPRCWQPDELTL
ncbi:leucyl/phenylalanyl-tRNA--protein transferase [Oceanisphaera psychrotolerans]|uniref:Leucyl/phenylalanyl-tRNA--protein transferase n=1 Tax=Oceanisphaera psychrotolerans TaxID=1414654 RepID=A0A1J4QB73_9GAMM|nr:leucyl/phenylalanyl-tRNA--protein transferase [Oceanisphaera psychrotolerans]OIN07627.1 leucyl/phenylalanyl-tRNA--protein transferase [Oceanisphaera psychrotolerans]